MIGLYRHYKGGTYQLWGLGTHTETEELLVIYMDANHPEKIWIRPRNMFFGTVIVDGKEVPRFELVESYEGL